MSDAVTEVQQQIASVCSRFFTIIGTLQRDAPPTNIEGEGIISSGNTNQNITAETVQENTATLIKELIQDLDTLKTSINALPPHTNETTDIATAVDLQHEETKKLKDLQDKIQESEEKLKELQNAYETVSNSILKMQSTTHSNGEVVS